MKKFLLKTSTGTISCRQWEPEGSPVGIIQIIHGIKEHTGRYESLAHFFTNAGFLVVGADHPGHGDAAQRLGYLAGGWEQAVKNIRSLYQKIHTQFQDLPYIMYGHSMGSFLLMTYLSVYSHDLDAAIISGTGWQYGAKVSAGRVLCRTLAGKYGEDSKSGLLDALMFGAYRKHFNSEDYDAAWISSDVQTVRAYEKDPLCGWVPTIQLCAEMLKGIQKNQACTNLLKMRNDLPVFFISGQLDPVGNFGNGVLQTVQAFKRAGMKDVLVELYPNMRHECHNEIGKERVFEDLLSWIRSKISPAAPQ